MIKKTIIWTGIAAIAVVGVTGLLVVKNKNETLPVRSARIEDNTKTEVCIQPPIPGKEAPFSVYRISSKNGGTIHHNGSVIDIPSNAFVSKNGNSVGDTVEIRYREYHDPLDIFLSGIPMKYDSAGLVRTFESAGMLEIGASCNGKELLMNEQSAVKISMASGNNDGKFNLYQLDTVQKNWIYLGKDKIVLPAAGKLVRSKTNEKENTALTEPVIMPVLADPQGYSFRISYDKHDFPELAAYDNVLFEVSDNTFKPAYYRINWKSISLYNSATEGLYTVKLKKADTTISVLARPVFDKENYANAMAKFEDNHKSASKERDRKEFEREAALQKTEKELAAYNSGNRVAAASNLVRSTVNRTFTIRRLGVYNMDFPIPPIVQYAYSLVPKKLMNNVIGEKLSYSTIFLVEKGKNSVFRFSKGEPVNCNPKANNLIWTITGDNQIAFFRISDYSKLLNGKENAVNPVLAKNQEEAFEEIRKFSGS
jgi:hypothetical protein